MRYLFIAEKPSEMRDVQSCYRKHKDEINQKVGEIDFVSLAGHVCRNLEPDEYSLWNGLKWREVDYPMIPNIWKVASIKGKTDILNKIKDSVDDYDGIIVGTDSDVEGYGIYYLVEEFLGLQNKHAIRFIAHSLADGDVLKGLLNMTDVHEGIHKRFTESFVVRSRADWLFGMNATRLASIKADELMTVGRVKAPTIRLVYDNSVAIENFKPKKYFQIESDYGDFKALMKGEDGKTASFDSLSSNDEIPNGIPKLGRIASIKKEQSAEHAPKLYDLPSIQIEAGQKYGYSPEQTLEYLQSLYEKHKVLSYPRTQCRYVSKEKAKEFRQMLGHMSVFQELSGYAENITEEDVARVQSDKMVVNDAEVNKEAHDAILPTEQRPILENMTEQEKNICMMVFRRLLAQFLPKGIDNKTDLVIRHGKWDFAAKGKTVVEQGWRVLYSAGKDKFIPDFAEGDEIKADEIKAVEKQTTPPKRLTQATLLSAMINIANLVEDEELRKSLSASEGIGTPATRGKIIKDIIAKGYVENKKGLYITDLGRKYIGMIGGLEISSPVFAAVMDSDIKKVQRGEVDYQTAYNGVLNKLNRICSQISSMKVQRRTLSKQQKCPKCGSEIGLSRYYYTCSEECGFKIPLSVCTKPISENELETLLSGKPVSHNSFKNKEGKVFAAKIVMKEDMSGVGFDFSSDIQCPNCGKEVTMNNGGAFCECGLKVFRKMAGKLLTDANLKDILQKGRTRTLKGFKSKAGNEFDAVVILDGLGVKFEFPKKKE